MQEVLQSEVEVELQQPQAVSSAEEDDFPSTHSLEMNDTVRDEISKLVQNLFLMQEVPRRVVFSGAESGCGCSWMCAHAAEVLASQGRGSVCVVDCNLRSPGLHKQFGTENHLGFSDAVLGSEPIRQYARRLSRNLWLMSAGTENKGTQVVLGSERMRSRLAELNATFDYVLIDAAPMNTSNEAILLGGCSDGVVLVLKAHSSRRESAQKVLQQLHASNVRALGAVLNQRTFPIPESLYKRL
jgi:protein-tyrosine kinase